MSVYQVSNKFIEIYNNNNESLSHKKLQKLVYLAYGFYLATQNKKLFDGKFEAWSRGTVSRELYYAIKIINNTYDVKSVLDVSNQSTENADIINQMASYIYRHFGNLTADKLEKLTNLPNSAWDKVYNNNELNIELQDSDIIVEMKNLINKLS